MGPIKETPPAVTWRERLEPMTAEPNEWMRVNEYALPSTAYSVVSALRRGDYPTPKGAWQFRASNIKGKGVVFAKFLGLAAGGPVEGLQVEVIA